MSLEHRPIAQPNKLAISEKQLRQVISPRYWVSLPKASERKRLKIVTIEKLDQNYVDRINSQIQISLANQSRLVYMSDRHTHVLDFEKNIYYSLNPNSLVIAQLNPSKSTDIPVYSGHLDARLSISQYLTFFNIHVDGNNFVHRFYQQDINTVPLIFSVSKNSPKAKLIFARSPYKENSMILGSETA